MLVNDRASAVGDMDGRSGLVTAVIADVGGAVKVSTPVEGGIEEDIDPSAVGDSEPTTYQYRAPELFVKKKLRRCSYSSDVWAMGVSIVEMDLGVVPFGKSSMRRARMDDIFKDMLRILYGTGPRLFDERSSSCMGKVRSTSMSTSDLLVWMSTLQLKQADALPWGKSRGIRFRSFLMVFVSTLAEGAAVGARIV